MDFRTVTVTTITKDSTSGIITFSTPISANPERNGIAFACKPTDYIGLDDQRQYIEVSNGYRGIKFSVHNEITITGDPASPYAEVGEDYTSEDYKDKIGDIYQYLVTSVAEGCCCPEIVTIGNVVMVDTYAELPSTGIAGTLYVVLTGDEEGTYYWDTSLSTPDYLPFFNDVLMYDTYADFPPTGTAGKLYLDKDQYSNAASRLYWWDDEASTPDYVPVTADDPSKLPLAGGSMSGPINEFQGANIASAGTTDIGAATGNLIYVTGTTTITALGTIQAGTERVVIFTGILTLTYNAVSLLLPGAANITTAANDIATFRSLGSGNWICTSYQRANGTAVVGPYLPLAGGSMTGAINEAQGANIASSGTTDIGAATGNYVTITGTTTITSFGTVQAGTQRVLAFTGVLTLTHSLAIRLPTNADIDTVAGDYCCMMSLGSGDWVCLWYKRAKGHIFTPDINMNGTDSLDTTQIQFAPTTSDVSQFNMITGTDVTAPVDGDVFASTQNTIANQISGTTLHVVEGFDTQTASVTVNTTAAETTLLTGIGDFGANFFTAGKTLNIFASGRITNTGTPTIRIRFYLDAVAHIDTTAVTMGTISGTGLWIFQGWVTCRSTGAGGTAAAQGIFNYWASTSSQRTASSPMTPTSAIDTTVALTPNLTVTWGTSSLSNSITCDIFEIFIVK